VYVCLSLSLSFDRPKPHELAPVACVPLPASSTEQKSTTRKEAHVFLARLKTDCNRKIAMAAAADKSSNKNCTSARSKTGPQSARLKGQSEEGKERKERPRGRTHARTHARTHGRGACFLSPNLSKARFAVSGNMSRCSWHVSELPISQSRGFYESWPSVTVQWKRSD
jgi:hypothetical protein